MDFKSITTLLSAGVLAALVTGIFSLFTSLSNNRKIKQLETMKQQFFFEQKIYDILTEEYQKIVSLPEVLKDVEITPFMDEEQLDSAVVKTIQAFKNRFDVLEDSIDKVIIYFDEKVQRELKELLEAAKKESDELVDRLIKSLSSGTNEGVSFDAFIDSVTKLQKHYKSSLQYQIQDIHKKSI